ncbi:hypothetical protein GCM10010524_63480 [Streptomyces mexicanus]
MAERPAVGLNRAPVAVRGGPAARGGARSTRYVGICSAGAGPDRCGLCRRQVPRAWAKVRWGKVNYATA